MHTTKQQQQQKNVWYSISRDGENRSILSRPKRRHDVGIRPLRGKFKRKM